MESEDIDKKLIKEVLRYRNNKKYEMFVRLQKDDLFLKANKEFQKDQRKIKSILHTLDGKTRKIVSDCFISIQNFSWVKIHYSYDSGFDDCLEFLKLVNFVVDRNGQIYKGDYRNPDEPKP